MIPPILYTDISPLPIFLKPFKAHIFSIPVSAISHRRRAKVLKNTAKNTSKAPKEVDLIIKSIPPSIIIEQPKDL